MSSLELPDVVVPQVLAVVGAGREDRHLAAGIIPTEDHQVLRQCRGGRRRVVHLVGAVGSNLHFLVPERRASLGLVAMQPNKPPGTIFRGHKHAIAPDHGRTASRTGQGHGPRPRALAQFERDVLPGRHPRSIGTPETGPVPALTGGTF